MTTKHPTHRRKESTSRNLLPHLHLARAVSANPMAKMTARIAITDRYKWWQCITVRELKWRKNVYLWSSHRGTEETNLTTNHEVVGSIPGLTQWVKDQVLL